MPYVFDAEKDEHWGSLSTPVRKMVAPTKLHRFLSSELSHALIPSMASHATGGGASDAFVSTAQATSVVPTSLASAESTLALRPESSASVGGRCIGTPTNPSIPSMVPTAIPSASANSLFVRRKPVDSRESDSTSRILKKQSQPVSLLPVPGSTRAAQELVDREKVTSCFKRFFESAIRVSTSKPSDQATELHEHKLTLAEGLIALFREHNFAWESDSYYVSALIMFCHGVANEAIVLTETNPCPIALPCVSQNHRTIYIPPKGRSTTLPLLFVKAKEEYWGSLSKSIRQLVAPTDLHRFLKEKLEHALTSSEGLQATSSGSSIGVVSTPRATSVVPTSLPSTEFTFKLGLDESPSSFASNRRDASQSDMEGSSIASSLPSSKRRKAGIEDSDL
jgi:hypothetical protein